MGVALPAAGGQGAPLDDVDAEWPGGVCEGLARVAERIGVERYRCDDRRSRSEQGFAVPLTREPKASRFFP